jgi:hypothetical protein
VPVPGRPRNPLGETPTRFHGRRQVFVARAGETPGLMDVDTRADTVAAGTIRRNYRQSVNFVPAPPPVDITRNNGLGVVTRALRYKASSVYRRGGNDNTRFGARRPFVPARHNSRPVTIAAGNQQGRPTIRNRMTSFGRRVAPVNAPSPAAERR